MYNILKPTQALTASYRKIKPGRGDFDKFKKELSKLINNINENEREDHNKILVRDFLINTFYNNSFVNSKGDTDLAIHLGSKADSKIGVLIEAKRPSKTNEMITKEKLNAKAMHEVILYYLRERIEEKNDDIKNILITNAYEWFIFDAQMFEKLFYNKELIKKYSDWKNNKKVSSSTNHFYNEIAKDQLNNLSKDITFVHFDIRKFNDALSKKSEEKKLIPIFKIISPAHLLKESFANDSNNLDKQFYNELLHIIGLEEKKEGSKKVITRKAEKERDNGSLLENTIKILQTKGSLNNFKDKLQFGENEEEQLFNVALELNITWINRILFLKLLEAQLVNYHKGDENYKFLNSKDIEDYDELFELFHEVLAQKKDERKDVKKRFENIPYLNSSLFEISELERKTFGIDSLKDRFKLPVFKHSIFKKSDNNIQNESPTLNYLFKFLDAYDFSSETADEIDENKKSIINASVLGLIFEKINGYKEGSYFTPGFITMYMARETLRRAVLQKFEDIKGWKCESIDELRDKIEYVEKDSRLEANELINSIKICDPAVGSGHFLVSCLNELLSIKSELKILNYRNGNRVKEFKVKVENDELSITDEDENPFKYHLNEKGHVIADLQKLQETLFHEKEQIIENCLFGVDINPNSVNICRLRLWIELLKNAYFTESSNYTELETLPNIDINIKQGNSLISRFELNADLSKSLPTVKWKIDDYKKLVNDYKNTNDKELKRSIQSLIDDIKSKITDELDSNHELNRKLRRLRKEYHTKFDTIDAFEHELTDRQKAEREKKKKKLEIELEKAAKEIIEFKEGEIYKNAFEWRFEFPEVLNEKGDFIGFDVVIGNPPYFSLSKTKEYSKYFERSNYKTYVKGTDIYVLFYERGNQILTEGGLLTFISSNSWLRVKYGDILKEFFKVGTTPLRLMNIEDIQIFEEATVESNIITLQKGNYPKDFWTCSVNKNYEFGSSLGNYFKGYAILNDKNASDNWVFADESVLKLKTKIEKSSTLLKNLNVRINFGIKTGLNEAFIIDEDTKNELLKQDPNSIRIIKPIIRGRDISKYYYKFHKKWVITTFPSLKINIQNYISAKNHLESYTIKRLEQSGEKGSRKKTNNRWFETQDNIGYWKDFNTSKIIWGEISDKPKFAYDEANYYAEATTFLMTGENLKFILAILNSKISAWYFNLISTTTGMGTNRWKKYKIEMLPIKKASNEMNMVIVNTVNKILDLKKSNPQADKSKLEAEIDKLIYELYGLTEEEIKIVEESVG